MRKITREQLRAMNNNQYRPSKGVLLTLIQRERLLGRLGYVNYYEVNR